MSSFREKVVVFGSEKQLVGVIGEAAAGGDAPAVILMNAGLLHRVGPYRMSVELSRRLNALGFPTLRFDLSGLGDSEMRKSTQSDWERAKLDIREAMDLMAKRSGSRRFVLWGFCSGADYAHPQALDDPRIAGAVMMDAYGYRTAGYWWRNWASRLFNPRKWRNFLGRLKQRLLPASGDPPIKGESYVREFPQRELIQSQIQGLLERGMRFLFLYTAGVPEYFNHLGQFWRMFPALSRDASLQVEHYAHTDHTYSLREDRERLLKRISDWMVEQF